MPRLLLALLGLLLGAEAYTLGSSSVRACAPTRRADAARVAMAVSLRTGDMVDIISGDDKGETGKLLAIDLKKGKVLVEGVNVRTKHVKPMKEGETGQLLKKEMPIAISKVRLADDQPDESEE